MKCDAPERAGVPSEHGGIVGVLADAGVEVILIGGLAAQAHGSARLTQDADFVYGRSDANIARLADALAPFSAYLRGAPAGLPFRFDPPTILRGLNFTLTTTIGDVDFLGEIVGGGSYEQLLPHSIELMVFGRTIRVLDLRTLIAAKRAAGRPKDLEAVAELEALLVERERAG
jgi:hypothetical protein